MFVWFTVYQVDVLDEAGRMDAYLFYAKLMLQMRLDVCLVYTKLML